MGLFSEDENWFEMSSPAASAVSGISDSSKIRNKPQQKSLYKRWDNLWKRLGNEKRITLGQQDYTDPIDRYTLFRLYGNRDSWAQYAGRYYGILGLGSQLGYPPIKELLEQYRKYGFNYAPPSYLLSWYNNTLQLLRMRAYHSLNHIESCLNEFGKVKKQAEQPESVELAIWYHDAIYDTSRTDNEEQSAALSQAVLSKYEKSSKLIHTVSRLILATKHKGIPKTIDQKILVDIDLSILGKSSEVFKEYEEGVSQEFYWVREDQYKAGRKQVLRTFLDRPHIYQTDEFRKRYEERARINLERAIKDLEK